LPHYQIVTYPLAAEEKDVRTMIVSRDGLRRWGGWRSVRAGIGALSMAAALGVACSDDEGGGGECIGGGGPVAGENENHCIENGVAIANEIGACVTGAEVSEAEGAEAEGEGEHEEGEHDEDEHPTLFGREADDDNCKYHVSFENTCITVNQPVTFTLTLRRLFDDQPGTGTVPSNPEIFAADDPSHISPSTNIRATERAAGTYEIGPVIFDQSGRWVVRFHYFDNCSEVPEDSPHSHAAFYIDVP
jgi:hypothetical protein